jgi:hypothetical protein
VEDAVFCVLRLALVLAAATLAAGCRPSRQPPRPPIINTTGKEQQWFQDRFAEHLLGLSRQDGKARFVTDGFFISEDPDGPRNEFVLGPGNAFGRPPDHHGSGRLWVRRIDENGVTIEYESWFDHRSFGPYKITVDRGTVHIPWKPLPPADQP